MFTASFVRTTSLAVAAAALAACASGRSWVTARVDEPPALWDVDANGPLDARAISEGLAGDRGKELAACFPVEQPWRVYFFIDAGGRPRLAPKDDTPTGPAAIVGCLTSTFEHLTFPTREGPTYVAWSVWPKAFESKRIAESRARTERAEERHDGRRDSSVDPLHVDRDPDADVRDEMLNRDTR